MIPDLKNIIILLFFVVIVLCNPSTAYPSPESVFASYKYIMGDNDTKNDARRICFLEAKRLAIEKAGTYIESSTEVRNFSLTRDEIRTFAGAIVKTEIASEEIKFIGENQVVLMTVKADIDLNSFRERVKEIKSDKNLEKKVRDQQRQLEGMEDKLKKLQQQLTTKNLNKIITLRKERAETFDKIDELDMIKEDIKRKTTVAVQNVVIGMTRAEVINLVGPPRAQYSDHLNYGNVWVVIENGVVTILVDSRCFKNYYGRAEYFGILNPCGKGQGIIKY